MLSSQYQLSVLGSNLGVPGSQGGFAGLWAAGESLRNLYNCLAPSMVLNRSKIDGRKRLSSMFASLRALRKRGQSKMM